jgi:proton glutamate symport protein
VRFATASKYLPAAGGILYVAGLAVSLLARGHAGFGAGVLGIVLRVLALVVLAAWALRRRSLTVWIFWSMVCGIELGLDAPSLALHLRVFSDLFLRLIEMIVAPLILCVLVAGIGRHGSSRDVSRLAVKSLIYFEVLTTIALAIGLAAINISKAGVGLTIANTSAALQAQAPSAPQLTWESFLLEAAPENIAKSVAENHVLQVAVFAILFGIAVGRLDEERRRPLLAFFESAASAMFQLTSLIMYLAPLAVGAALAYAVAHSGLGVFVGLGKLLLTLYVAIAAFIALGLYPAALLAKVPLRRFVVAVSEPAAIAFATSTSEAALPVAMERMEQLGMPANIVGFVIPTGYSFNLAGSCLYLSLAAVFMAQAGGTHLGLVSQLMMLWTMMLTSKGVAGIPRAVFVVLMATAATFHLPVEILPILLGIDPLMDMGRSAINVIGNCLATVVVARWEGPAATTDSELRYASKLPN